MNQIPDPRTRDVNALCAHECRMYVAREQAASDCMHECATHPSAAVARAHPRPLPSLPNLGYESCKGAR